MSRSILLGLLLCLCGCAWTGQASWVQDTLYFGLSKPGGTVSVREWQGFVDGEVTPRFPDGLTQLQGDGQWRSDGKIQKEGSRVLILLHKDTDEADSKVSTIIEAYKLQFQQQSVLRVKQRVQASF